MNNANRLTHLLIALIVCAFSGIDASANTVIVDALEGEPGLPGADGVPGLVGGVGGSGADAVAVASGADGDYIAIAEAYGGDGGDGGRGGSGLGDGVAGGNGGVGGRGGDAFASAINVTGFESPFTELEAIGGRGGHGGAAGNPGFDGMAGVEGDSGNGGNAFVKALTRAVQLADSEVARIIAVARGGGAGNVAGPGVQAGHGGDAFGRARMTLENNPDATGVINMRLFGGAGGWGVDGASGGNGGAVHAGPVFVDAGEKGEASITLSAVGGSGGRATGYGGGSAGDGASVSLSNSAWGYAESLVIELSAKGGSSGYVWSGENGVAGSADTRMMFDDAGSFETVDSHLQISLEAVGGRGAGRASIGGQAAAGADAFSYAEGTSSRRFVSLSSIAEGGKGGNGTELPTGGNGEVGAKGGFGGDANAISRLDHSQSGVYSDGVVQTESRATAGAAGFTFDTSEPLTFRGATATAESRTVSSQSPDVRASSFAEGGMGSSSRVTDGGEGGEAHASAYAMGPGDVTASAESVGGGGGRTIGVGNTAGMGSAASTDAYAESTDGGRVGVIVIQRGGNGGLGITGAQAGAGADVLLHNSAVGVTSGELRISQFAYGGDAGTVFGSAIAGVAGNAATLSEFSHFGTSLLVTDIATGGAGSHYDFNGGVGSAGGSATVGGSLVAAGDAQWNLLAQGGLGGEVNFFGTTGSGGAAEAGGVQLLARDDATLLVELRGGNAGSNNEADFGGDGGAVMISEPIYAASSNDGDVNVVLDVTGGSAHLNGSTEDIILVNQVDGDTLGHLDLTQNVVAGSSGVWNDTQSNRAANAISELVRSSGALSLSVHTAAAGGSGPDGVNSNGGAGGFAESTSVATSGESIAEAEAFGGDGGDVGESESLGVGRGGDAHAEAIAESLLANESAQAGGVASGGDTGQSGFNHVATRGGHASGRAQAVSPNFSSAYFNAFGGNGHSGGSEGFGNDGGNADSTSIAIAGYAAISIADAYGGSAGLGGVGIGTSGTAHSYAMAEGKSFAIADATSDTGGPGNTVAGRAQARALANSDAPQAYASSSTRGNDIVSRVGAAVGGRLAGVDHSLSVATVATVRNALAEDFQLPETGLSAIAVGMPDHEVVTALLADTVQVVTDFDVGGTSDVLGFINMSTGTIQSANTDTFSGLTLVTKFDIDTTQLDSEQDLLVGLLGSQALGDGFETLRFRIDVESSTVLDKVFDDVLAASEFFTDNTLDLGPWADLVGSNAVLNINFYLYADILLTDMGFGFTAIFGNSTLNANPVPVPAAFWMLLSALGALLWRNVFGVKSAHFPFSMVTGNWR